LAVKVDMKPMPSPSVLGSTPRTMLASTCGKTVRVTREK
jgi:hypothetical protein